MTHGSLFSGIGGFDLAAQWMGWENKFHCEWKEFNQRVLKYYWPNAASYGDIAKTDFSKWRNRIDIVTGGFPCQPYSVAGKRKGTADDRHLWPAMLNAIRTISPRWVVGENVLGIVDWNKGLVFHEIQTDLEAAGYRVWAYVLPACGKDAPHQRYRTWFVAYTNGDGFGKINSTAPNINERQFGQDNKQPGNRRGSETNGYGEGKHTAMAKQYEPIGRDKWPSKPPILNRNDGVPRELVDITFSEWTKVAIESMGNAIVPDIALQIFKAIEHYEANV